MEKRSFTPNQVVAHNLRRARLMRGLSLDDAADLLAPYVGTKWKRANLSAMERSAAGGRPRNFDADDLIAFSLAFDVSPVWFLVPPANASEISAPRPEGGPLSPSDLVDLVFFRGWLDVHARLAELPETHQGAAREAQATLLDTYVAEAAATAEPEQRLRETEQKLQDALDAVHDLTKEMSEYRLEATRRLRRAYSREEEK